MSATLNFFFPLLLLLLFSPHKHTFVRFNVCFAFVFGSCLCKSAQQKPIFCFFSHIFLKWILYRCMRGDLKWWQNNGNDVDNCYNVFKCVSAIRPIKHISFSISRSTDWLWLYAFLSTDDNDDDNDGGEVDENKTKANYFEPVARLEIPFFFVSVCVCILAIEWQ